MVITNNVSVEDAGVFFLTITICYSISTLCTLGFTNAFVRFMGGFYVESDWTAIKGVFFYGLKCSVMFSLVIAFVIAFFSNEISNNIFNKNELTTPLLLVSFAIPFYAVIQLVSFSFQGIQKQHFSVFLSNIAIPLFVIICISTLLLYSKKIYITNMVFIYALAIIITSILSYVKWINQKELKGTTNYSHTKSLKESAKPLWTMMLMSMLVQYSGLFIGGVYLTFNELAIFSAAQRVSMLASFVLVSINFVAAPLFAASYKLNQPEELEKTSIFCSRLIFIIATPVLVLTLYFSDSIMNTFGSDYKEGTNILAILLIGQYINVITGTVGFLLNMTGHERDMRNVVFISGVFAVLLGAILIPIYGVLGAALTTSISLSTQNILAMLMIKKRLGFLTLNIFKR